MLCTFNLSTLANAEEEESSRRYMTIKTNIAYDAIAIPNFDFCIGLSEHITLDIPVMWSFWNWKPDLGLRVLGTQPRILYWFQKSGQRHAAGIDTGMYFYNLRIGDYRYQDMRSGFPPNGIWSSLYLPDMPIPDTTGTTTLTMAL